MHILNANAKKLVVAIAAIGVLALVIPVAGIAMHHLLPPSWTGEAARLARILGRVEGASIAEIGAGSGAMATAIARLVGRRGSMLVTEIAPAKRARLGQLAPGTASAHLAVVEALEDRTNLPSGCCDALYMRNVLHHVKTGKRTARTSFARFGQVGWWRSSTFRQARSFTWLTITGLPRIA